MSNIALQIERLAPESIPAGGNLIFDTIKFSEGNVSYNPLTGVITINQPGKFQIHWWAATQASLSFHGIVLAISSSQGDFLKGNSPIRLGEVSGVGIIEVVSTPVTLSLANAGTARVTLSGITPLKSTLVIVEQGLDTGGPTGSTGPTGFTGPTGTVQPNSFDVYVQADAVGGNGTQANPFGTIQQGVSAVSPTGTVHILGGIYEVTSTITVNKSGVTIKGYPSTRIILEAATILFLVAGTGITIEGLTITSDKPYPVEFIQFAGLYHKLVDCVIFGPGEEGPSTNWVANRGFVTQSNVIDLIVQNTIFHSLQQAAYLNTDSSGKIVDTVVYNTRGYVVDNALFVFSGNSWGSPENAFDISLLTDTITGPPYDPVTALSANNSSATISDQR